MPRFQASVDYYKIKIRDSILALGAQVITVTGQLSINRRAIASMFLSISASVTGI